MMEKLAQAGVGGGCTPVAHPFNYIYPVGTRMCSFAWASGRSFKGMKAKGKILAHPQNVRFQNVRFQNVWFPNVRFQNVSFTKRQLYKTAGFKTSGFKTSSF
jgi:hypothetical protein